MNEPIEISDDLALYSGDVINLRADDGTYVKRWCSLPYPTNRCALLCYSKSPDVFGNFTVLVVGPNKIRLVADNGNFCKRYFGWNGMSIISMDMDKPDDFSDFVVTPKGKDKITLQAENGQFLKRYYGYRKRSVIVACQDREDEYSQFLVERPWVNIENEEVKDIEFGQLKFIGESPLAIDSVTNRNTGSEMETIELTVEKSVDTTQSFEWARSFRIGVETKFEAKFPVFSGEIDAWMEAEFTKGGSRSSKDSTTVTVTYPVKCAPHKKTTGTVFVRLGEGEVPYTATVIRTFKDSRGNREEYTYKVEGTFHGTTVIDTECKREEEDM